MLIDKVNKIALSSNNDKRLHTLDGIASHPFGANARKVWKTELLQYINKKCLILVMLPMKIKQTTTQVPDHAYRKIIIGGSVSGKTNA